VTTCAATRSRCRGSAARPSCHPDIVFLSFVFGGDAGETAPSRASRRRGVEAERVASFGVTWESRGNWSGTLGLRHFGPRPLVEPRSARLTLQRTF
jgi:hypothetical protein